MTRHFIIPVFVPHLGCPHDCIFCNQRRIAGASTSIRIKDVKNTIDRYLNYFDQDSFIEVAFYGGSFTAIDINIQRKLLEVPLEYKREGLINEIRLSTRPDAINREILYNLQKYKVDTIELGAQSMDEKVLARSERGHSVGDIRRAASLIKEYKFKLGLQMMVGLPKDNLNIQLKTAKEFISLEPDCVRIYPTLVVKDTYLERDFLNKVYQPLSLENAVNISSILLTIFNLNNINVIRVGLQSTESMQMGKDIKAGPFHPAFRQLAESNIYKNILDNYFKNNNFNLEKKLLKIKASNREISNIVGQNSSNKKYWIEKYNLKDIKFYPEHRDNLKILIDDFKDTIDREDLQKQYVEEYLNNNKLEYRLSDLI